MFKIYGNTFLSLQGPDTSPGGDELSEQSKMVGDVRCRHAYSISKSNYLILIYKTVVNIMIKSSNQNVLYFGLEKKN